MIDLAAALVFVTTHARVLDRRLLGFRLGDTAPTKVVNALNAYRNEDGGFGWAIEPDLRSASSQPVGALLAFEVLHQITPTGDRMGVALCDWVAGITLPGGGVPFALPADDDAGSAPWWASADPTEPSLHITAAICGAAHRAGDGSPGVAGHPWLTETTDWCLRRITDAEGRHPAYEQLYVTRFLDAVAGSRPEARDHLERLADSMPPTWQLPVEGGTEDEKLEPIQFAPHPDRPVRRLVPDDVIEDDLDRLEAAQTSDGGWAVDFVPVTAAATIEWRGFVTVQALLTLAANGRLDLSD